jgi:hypothetical protein
LRPQTLALWLSAGVPCIAYIITASAYAYWLDSGEFVAAAVQLDIAHPPGHPLSALYGKLLTLVPLGSLSFRVALGQAIATAAACALLCRANAAALRGMRLDPHVTWAFALFGAWLSAFGYGVWFQAVRPEVYALQTLCVALVYERLMHASSPENSAAAPLLTAALTLGLGLTNHHLIALLLVPAFLPALWNVVRARRWHVLGGACVLGALGLSTYLYLPLRASHAPPMNMGDPSNWERFFWVVSARVYAHDMGSEAAQPLDTRMLDVFGLWFEDLGGLPLALACLGLYLGLRLAAARAALLTCGLVLLTDGFARAWLGSVRANPDILGYLAPSYLALGTLSACCLGAIAWSWKRSQRSSWAQARRFAWLVPCAALALVPGTAQRASLADFVATDVLDDLRVRQLPPRAVVLESSPQTVFRSAELHAVEGARPDLAHVPLPFLRYPNAAAQLTTRQPFLAPVVDSFMSQHDQLRELAPLRALAAQRPLFVELDTRVDPALYPALAPRGVYAQLSPGEPAPQLQRTLASFYALQQARLGTQQREPETSKQLLWLHYMNALQLGALGYNELARDALAQALTLQPTEQRLHTLREALNEEAPLDTSAFLKF